MGAYLLAARIAHDRQIWFKRLATPPVAYVESPCCRAPFLPLITRDVRQAGLLCQHCNETLVPFDEIPEELRSVLANWASYRAVAAIEIAHLAAADMAAPTVSRGGHDGPAEIDQFAQRLLAAAR